MPGVAKAPWMRPEAPRSLAAQAPSRLASQRSWRTASTSAVWSRSFWPPSGYLPWVIRLSTSASIWASRRFLARLTNQMPMRNGHK